MAAFEDLKNFPPMVTPVKKDSSAFTSPKVFQDQSARSTKLSMKLPTANDFDDDDDEDNLTPAGRGLTDLFYSPDKGLGLGLLNPPVSAKKATPIKSKEQKREDKQIERAVIVEEKKIANRAKRKSLIPAPAPVESGGGGAVRVVSSKPRGRPVGSKNKPKDL